jgi:hypothetical protein
VPDHGHSAKFFYIGRNNLLLHSLLHAAAAVVAPPHDLKPYPAIATAPHHATATAPDLGKCWGPSASEGPQKRDLTIFSKYASRYLQNQVAGIQKHGQDEA